jgi:hypothetical protein
MNYVFYTKKYFDYDDIKQKQLFLLIDNNFIKIMDYKFDYNIDYNIYNSLVNLFSNAFLFNSFNIFKNYFKKINNRSYYFIKNIFKLMINDNIKFNSIELSNDNIINLNNSFNIRLFSNNFPKINAFNNNLILQNKTFNFELENTLIYNKNDIYIPIQNNIDILNYIKKFGNKIIINTSIHKKITINKIYDMLLDFKITYDTLIFNDKDIDFYISSKNISSYQNLEKSLGFYNNKIDCRDFNEVIDNNINTYKKISNDLSGEIHFYKNIPNELKDIFPILLNYDKINNTFFEIEKINGITISHLFLNEELTILQFDNVLGTIKRIHNYIDKNYIDNINIDNINIYENYSNKLIKRYSTHDYSIYPNSNNIYNILLKYLNQYEYENKGNFSMIHGDTVFSNILINKLGKIKLIDMRGKQNNILTMYGDKIYDYAKIYQSLLGYDEILLNKNIPSEYRQLFITHFHNKFIEIFGIDNLFYLKIITASLLFTLIPLHNNEKCNHYYNLIEKYDLLSLIDV